MFSVRLVEQALPSVDRDIDSLVEWMTETLCLVRKRGDAMADGGRAGPVHRLLRDHLFGQPLKVAEGRVQDACRDPAVLGRAQGTAAGLRCRDGCTASPGAAEKAQGEQRSQCRRCAGSEAED